MVVSLQVDSRLCVCLATFRPSLSPYGKKLGIRRSRPPLISREILSRTRRAAVLGRSRLDPPFPPDTCGCLAFVSMSASETHHNRHRCIRRDTRRVAEAMAFSAVACHFFALAIRITSSARFALGRLPVVGVGGRQGLQGGRGRCLLASCALFFHTRLIWMTLGAMFHMNAATHC